MSVQVEQGAPLKAATVKGFRSDIQGLRAVAVVVVIVNHLFGWPTGGFVGVDVFFVISGFLITGLLLREHQRTGSISFVGFYARRFKRIMPAALLVLATTVTASLFLMGHSRFRGTVMDGLWALFFAGNWRFAAKGTDYFQEGLQPSPLLHFWSLGVEEQFYLVWPWLMLAILVLGAREMGWGRVRSRAICGLAVIGITIASLIWAVYETSTSETLAYFSTFSRAWELGVGAILAVLGNRIAIKNAITRSVLGWVGLLGIIAALFVVPAGSGFPAPWALLPVLSAGLVLAAGVGGEQRHVWPLTNRGSVYVGEISYSLYLWHFPVLVLLVTVMPSDTPTYYVAALALTAALAVASYHLLEKPLRHAQWFPNRHSPLPDGSRTGWKIIGAVVLLVATVGVFGLYVQRSSTTPAAQFAAISAAAVPAGVAPGSAAGGVAPGSAPVSCLGAAAMDPDLTCEPSTAEVVIPEPGDESNDTGGAFECWISEGQPMKVCSFGPTGADAKRVALLGDSHAAMLLPGLKTQLDAQNWRLDSYVGRGCQWAATGSGSECDGAMGQIQDTLLNGPAYDIAIVTAARQKVSDDKDWVSGIYAAAWGPVAARGTKIIVVADNPGVSAAAIECVDRVGFSVTDNECATPRSDAMAVVDPLIKAAELTPGATVVDLSQLFCNESACPVVIGNVIAYRDTVGHITGTFSKTLAPYLVDAIAATG